MTSTQELITLTKQYILKEYSLKEMLPTDAETYQYYRAFAQKGLKKSPSPVIPPRVVKKPPPTVKPIMKKPAPPPPAPAPKKIEKQETQITSEIDFKDLRLIFESKFPNLSILDEIPDSLPTNRVIEVTEIVIFSRNASVKENLFLFHLSQAITRCLAPCTVVNHWNDEWENIRLVIGTEKDLSGLNFSPKYTLADLSTYLKRPQLKATLWEEIKVKI